MDHIRAYFEAFKDWLHRHPITSPSGLSKSWILVQATSLLCETGSQIIVPITGEQSAFTVTRLSGVEGFADLVEKARKANISELGDEDIKTVFSRLKKRNNFPFFALDDQKDPEDPTDKLPTQDLNSFLSESLQTRKEITVIRLTEVRNSKGDYLTVKDPKSEDDKKILVPRDGSRATSLILLVHSQSPQPDRNSQTKQADPPDNAVSTGTQIPDTTSLKVSEPSQGPSQSPEEQFRLFEFKKKVWSINTTDVDELCLRFIRKIVDDYRKIAGQCKIANTPSVDMSVWKRILALLLTRIGELLKEDKLKGQKGVVPILKEISKKQSWSDMQKLAENVLKESLIESLKPILMSLPDTAKLDQVDVLKKNWTKYSKETVPFEDIFATKTADGNGSSSTRRCPICALGYNSELLLEKHIQSHIATYGETVLPQSQPDPWIVCPYCDGIPFTSDEGLRKHFRAFHGHLIRSFTIPVALSERNRWVKCSYCPSSDDRKYYSQIRFVAHLAAEHKDLNVDQPSTSSPKRPIEQSDSSSKSKKIASIQDASHASPAIPPPPNYQNLGNASNAYSQDRPSVIQRAPPRSSARTVS